MAPNPRKLIYPVFLPHAGCPYRCVYCNQNAVATGAKQSDPADAALSRISMYADQVRHSAAAKGKGEIAFYGGTFTALPLSVLKSILDLTAGLVDKGVFSGVRFSTRPDCIDDEVCGFLARYPVSAVELGAQSMCDAVLAASGRGYSSITVLDACARIRRRGWVLGIQLMAGLPEDSRERFLESVRAAIDQRPDFMRIYPTLVLTGTSLAASYRAGTFRPLLLEEALQWVVPAFEMLRSAGIPLIRIGLHADPELEKAGVILAGPYHPAFGSLVRGRWWRDRVNGAIFELVNGAFTCETQPDLSSPTDGWSLPARLLVRVPGNQVGDVVGPGRCNVRFWETTWNLREVRVVGSEGGADSELELKIE